MSTVAMAPVLVPIEIPTALAALAARNGMTVEEWEAHTDRLEADESRLRAIDRTMRATPRYRGAA